MQLEKILNDYELMEAQLLYNKAVSLLKLISDEELEYIFTEHPILFSKITNVKLTKEDLLKDRNIIREAIEVFIQTIEARHLSKDEFDAMTLDEVKDHIEGLICVKTPMLYRIIDMLENDSRD